MDTNFKKSNVNIYLIYTVLFAVIAVLPVIYFGFNGKSFVGDADAVNGYYPSFVYVGNYIRSIPGTFLNYHRLPTYDFLIGYGGNIFETIGILGDPFNWISVFFPGESSVVGYGVAIFLRMYVAGIGFILWGLHKGKNSYAVIAGAICYAFCGYAIYTGTQFYNYMTAFSAFPFLVAGVDDVIDREKKASAILMFGMVITVLDGFAFLYMDTVFFSVYIFIRSIHKAKLDKGDHVVKSVASKYLICILHYVLGVGIAASIFIPDLSGHLKSSRANVDITSIFVSFSVKEILEKMVGFVTNNIFIYGLCIGPLAFCCLMFLFTRKKDRDIRAIVFITIIGYFLLGFHVLTNCFIYADYAVGRWEYILYFCIFMALTFVLGDVFEGEVLNLRSGVTAGFLLCLAIWFVLSLNKGFSSQDKYIIFLLILGIWGGSIVVLRLNIRWKVQTALLICVISVVIGGYPRFYNKNSFMDSNLYTKIMNSSTIAYSEKDQNSNAFRTDVFDSPTMISLATGYRSTRSYFSVQNDALYDFLRDMAASTSIFGGNVNMGTLDGRKSLETIMGVGTYSDVGNASILHNNYDMKLPIGFAYDSYMLNDEAKKLDPLVRSNGVMSMVYLEDEPEGDIDFISYNEAESKPYEVIPTEVDYSEVIMDGDWIEIKNNNDFYIRYPKGSIVDDENTEYYLYIKSIEMERSLSTIDFSRLKMIRFTPAGEAANENGEYLIKLAINDDVVDKGYIDLSPLDGKYRFGEIELRRLDTSGYADSYKELARNALNNIVFTPNRVSGRILCEDEKILFMSILYDERWSCKVDGQLARIIKADSGFSAVEIGAGEHEVVFEYGNTLNKVAVLISFCTLIITVIYFHITKRKANVVNDTSNNK